MTDEDYAMGVLAFGMLIFIVFAIFSDNKQVEYKYWLAEQGVYEPVKFCNIDSGIVTYQKDNYTLQKLCAHCVCRKEVKDGNR